MSSTSKGIPAQPVTPWPTASETPDFAVPVVRLIVTAADGRVLVLRRRSGGHAPGAWCLPGGKVDYGETVAHTVVKELSEETALTCTSAEFLFFQDSLPLAAGQMHCLNLYFRCAVTGTVALDPESSEYAWIGPDDLLNYGLAFRNDEGLLRYWAGSR